MIGHTSLRATAKKSLRRFNLDLVLPASRVLVDRLPATFTQTRHELIVTPRHRIAGGHTMEIDVFYAGKPGDYTALGRSPWIRTRDGAAAVGEPEIAPWWFPSNDHPRDKAHFDVRITVPKSVEALGNGVLVSKKATGNKRTWHWREHKPMTTYLAFFVAGQFDITRSTTRSGKPVINAIASNGGREGRLAARDLARTPEVVNWQARQWGPYPFDALGGVAPAADFGFALENQTRPVYTRGFWSGGSNIYVVVHELGHQWFGDSVAVRNWRDIWLNEGFATFTTWLWSEQHGEGSARQIFKQDYRDLRGDRQFWRVKIGNPGAGNEFDGADYERGAMTLQALRIRIGNRPFFTVMRTWARTHKHGNGSIRQFINLSERISGKNLGSFFDNWLYSSVRPRPTRANGFPPGFVTQLDARTARPESWSKLRSAQSLLLGAEHRDR